MKRRIKNKYYRKFSTKNNAKIIIDKIPLAYNKDQITNHKNINDFVKIGQELRLKVIEVDEENHRVKLSYKQIHKTRGVRCRLPEYTIDFEPLAKKMPEWIEKYEEGKNE